MKLRVTSSPWNTCSEQMSLASWLFSQEVQQRYFVCRSLARHYSTLRSLSGANLKHAAAARYDVLTTRRVNGPTGHKGAR
jgi:hypothetical protein